MVPVYQSGGEIMSRSILPGGRGSFLRASLLSLWSSIAMPSPPATQVRTFHLDAPLARVFPLFTAEGERAWAPGWEPRILSGTGERGSAFITRGHDNELVTWIVTRYRPSEGRASYARLVQDSNIGLVDVSCTEQPGGGTDVEVRYTLTGVSKTGQALVAKFLEDGHYERMIEAWQTAISKALR
jgi:hypothetical protein